MSEACKFFLLEIPLVDEVTPRVYEAVVDVDVWTIQQLDDASINTLFTSL